MQQSQPSVPPPEYTRQDPTPSTPSMLLGSSRVPSSQAIPRNSQPQSQIQPQSQPSVSQEYYATSKPTASTTITPDYARPPSPTPSTQTTASTILPTYAQTGSYKGFPSEEAYIAALTEWAETKKYIQPTEEGQTLSGFFGYKTMDEYTQGGKTQKDEARAARKQSQGQGERQGFAGFLKRLAKKDEGGGHSTD